MSCSTLWDDSLVGFWKGSVFPPLDRNSAKFYTGAIYELGLVVDVEKFSKEGDSWFHPKVNLTEDLELTKIG